MTRNSEVPAVSVIIPTFNAADTVVDQLDALARQDLDRPWEAIVCDNGSTDNTVRKVREWIADRGAFRLIDASHHRGASAARNGGAATAIAPLLAFCDADDVVADDWLAEMVAALEHADVVGGVVDADSLAPKRAASVSWTTQAPIVLGFWPEYAAGATNNLGVRAAAFHQIEGFDETLSTCEDIDFCWRAQLAGFTFATCSSAIVRIRRRVGRRAVFRQAGSYGRGEGLLRRKWSEQAARYARSSTQERSNPASHLVASDHASETPTHRRMPANLERAWRSIMRLGSPCKQADLLWRCGFWLGLRSELRKSTKARKGA